MAGRIENILVVSDMDGTLVTGDQRILPCDIETIRLFTSLGGRFTVASGRTFRSVGMHRLLLPLLAPTVTSGGCVIYDFNKQMVVKSSVLPQMVAREAMVDVLTAFPTLGAMVMGNDTRLYQVAPSAMLDKLITDERMIFFNRPDEDLPELWNKVLFAGPPQQLEEVREFAKKRSYPGVYFLRTSPIYYEMMPEGVDKGSAVRDLAAMLNVSLANTIVIGDYYNDIHMMKEAGYSVAMGNAPDEVKKVANEITGTNEQGGVGQFLYKLIQQYEG